MDLTFILCVTPFIRCVIFLEYLMLDVNRNKLSKQTEVSEEAQSHHDQSDSKHDSDKKVDKEKELKRAKTEDLTPDRSSQPPVQKSHSLDPVVLSDRSSDSSTKIIEEGKNYSSIQLQQ